MLPTLVLVLALVHVAVFEEDLYKIPPNINVDDILSNERLTKSYINCCLEKPNSKCTPEGEKLKKTIPEALANDCKKCNDTVKEQAKKVLRHVIKNYPDLWKELEEKFDKDGAYRKKYKAEYEKEGIAI